MGEIIDKDSMRYFMSEMSQKEFEERNKDKIKCTDFEFNRIQPELSKREDSACDCHRCFKDNLLKTYYPWLYEQEMKYRDGKILCEKIQDKE